MTDVQFSSQKLKTIFATRILVEKVMRNVKSQKWYFTFFFRISYHNMKKLWLEIKICIVRTKFVHTIQAGDSLYKLSRQYHTTVTELILGNPGVNPYNLQIGMKLFICPGEGYVPPQNPGAETWEEEQETLEVETWEEEQETLEVETWEEEQETPEAGI